MSAKRLTMIVLLAVLAACGAPQAEAARLLDAETIRAGLRTANADEEAYITYVVAVRDQGRLSAKLVESSFHWARRKPRFLDGRRFQYFKHALREQAAKVGVALPRGTPDLTPTITGRVVLRVLLLDVPCPNFTVTLAGTKRKTTTNTKGEFRFSNVPYGAHTLNAQGLVLLIPHKGSAKLSLPTPPPSSDSVFVKINLK